MKAPAPIAGPGGTVERPGLVMRRLVRGAEVTVAGVSFVGVYVTVSRSLLMEGLTFGLVAALMLWALWRGREPKQESLSRMLSQSPESGSAAPSNKRLEQTREHDEQSK